MLFRTRIRHFLMPVAWHCRRRPAAHPGTEKILATYCGFSLFGWHLMFDYQFIDNLAYNENWGPFSATATRPHGQFLGDVIRCDW
jgi:hypothetical protein